MHPPDSPPPTPRRRPECTFTADGAGSKRLIEQLNAYFQRNVIPCDHLTVCRSSAERKDLCFNAGQFPHVGSVYDLSGDGRPWRIAICGQEAGRKQPYRTIAERSPAMSAWGRKVSFAGRNKHMQGTTNALRLLFGLPLSSEPGDDFILVDGERRHIFDAFALINALSCSAMTAAVGKNGKPTREMQRNCVEHLRATVMILRPTVLVSQGDPAQRMLWNAFPDLEARGHGVWMIRRLNTLVVPLAHPSARDDPRRGARTVLNWANLASPYLRDEVAPLLREVHRRMRQAPAGK